MLNTVLRHPVIAFGYFNNLKKCITASEIDQEILICLKHQDIICALKFSNLKFYNQLLRDLSKDQNNISNYRLPLLRYFNRMSSRTTLYKALSATSYSEAQAVQKPLTYLKLKKYNVIQNEFINFKLNPTFWSENQIMHVWSFKKLNIADTSIFNKYENFTYFTNDKTSLMISDLKGAVHKKDELISYFEKKAFCSKDQAIQILNKLIEDEILLPDKDDDPLDNEVFAIVSAQTTDEEIKDKFIHPISSLQVNSLSFSDQSFHEVYDFLFTFTSLFHNTYSPTWLELFKLKFKGQFPQGKADFLEVIHKINFERKEKDVNDKLQKSFRPYLNSLIDQGTGPFSEKNNVELRLEDLTKLKAISNKYFKKNNEGMSATALLTHDPNKGIWVKNFSGPSANRYLSHHALFNKKVLDDVKERWETEKKLSSPAILCEIINNSDSKVSPLINRKSFADYYIILNASTSIPEEKIIRLEDLAIKLVNNNVILFSKKLNQQIIPVSMHKISHTVAHTIERLLVEIGLNDQLISSQWTWQNVIQRSYYPRLTYKEFIIAPRIWKLSKHFLKEHIEDINFHGIIKKNYNIDEEVFYIEGDKQTFLLLSSLESKLILKDILLKTLDESITFQEIIGKPQEENGFFTEYIVPTKSKSLEYISNEKDFQNTQEVFSLNPLEDHVSLHIKVDKMWASLVIARILPPLKIYVQNLTNIKRWFYIQYTDNGHEIRVRFFGKNIDEHTGKILSHACALIEQMIPNFTEKVTISPYLRSLTLYGNVLGNELYEEITHFDSNYSLVIFQKLVNGIYPKSILDNSDNIPLEKEILWIFFSAHFYLKSFNLNSEAQEKILLANKNLWRNDAQFKDINFSTFHKYFKTNKKILGALIADENRNETIPFISDLFQAFSLRLLQEKDAVEKVKQSVNEGLLIISTQKMVSRLIHISKVRISLKIDHALEALILEFLYNLYQDNIHKKG